MVAASMDAQQIEKQGQEVADGRRLQDRRVQQFGSGFLDLVLPRGMEVALVSRGDQRFFRDLWERLAKTTESAPRF